MLNKDRWIRAATIVTDYHFRCQAIRHCENPANIDREYPNLFHAEVHLDYLTKGWPKRPILDELIFNVGKLLYGKNL